MDFVTLLPTKRNQSVLVLGLPHLVLANRAMVQSIIPANSIALSCSFKNTVPIKAVNAGTKAINIVVTEGPRFLIVKATRNPAIKVTRIP